MPITQINSPSFPLSKALWKKAAPIYATNRAYHNTDYIEQGWQRLADIYIKPTLPQEMAWIAHRVAYDPNVMGHEKKSAQWIDEALKGMKLELGEKSAVREAKLIVESTSDYIARTPSAIPILDVAMQRLATEWKTFAEYAWRLKEESPHLSENDWIERSQDFFKQLLSREQIFLTPEAKRRWERRAKDNLTQAIAQHPFAQQRLFGNDEAPPAVPKKMF
jgi:predicted metal-dependent HD superfamily phosphohydrolase